MSILETPVYIGRTLSPFLLLESMVDEVIGDLASDQAS